MTARSYAAVMVGAMLVAGVVCSGLGEAREAKATKSFLAIEDVPEPARSALTESAQHHSIPVVVRWTAAGGKVTYEVTATIGTTPWFIKVDADGKVLDRHQVLSFAPAHAEAPSSRTTHAILIAR